MLCMFAMVETIAEIAATKLKYVLVRYNFLLLFHKTITLILLIRGISGKERLATVCFTKGVGLSPARVGISLGKVFIPC